jgi:hypothetical protein
MMLEGTGGGVLLNWQSTIGRQMPVGLPVREQKVGLLLSG